METNRTYSPGTATDEPVPSVHLRTQGEAEAYRAGISEGMRRARGGGEAAAPPGFDPVPLRYRRDGWTPERQVGFIRALSECGCVTEACRRVGLSAESAYELARRPDAQSFRIAWDIAMDNAVRRVGDGAFSRAINGIEIPHFYKGELVGTHRRWNERLTMFILRTRDPERFGRRAETAERIHSREGRALDLAELLHWVKKDAEKEAKGRLRTVHPGLGARADEDDEYGDGNSAGSARDMAHIYAFAPKPQFDEDEEEDEEAEDCAAADVTDEEAEAAWTAVQRHLHAVAEADPDYDEPVAPLSHFIGEALARLRASSPIPSAGEANRASTGSALAGRGECPDQTASPKQAAIRHPASPEPVEGRFEELGLSEPQSDPPSPSDVPRTSSTSAPLAETGEGPAP